MRALRFVALALTALTLGLAFSHVLEMPAKLAYSGSQWLLLQQTLYGNFRALGMLLALGGVARATALVHVGRARRPALYWTFFAATCLVAAHVAWWTGAFPVNAVVAQHTPQMLPPDLAQLRQQWEHTHVVRAVLQGAALGALLASLLAETRR